MYGENLPKITQKDVDYLQGVYDRMRYQYLEDPESATMTRLGAVIKKVEKIRAIQARRDSD